ncbi:MAG: acetylornithine carbamoyltransferase [Gammaproteobacteria bacterium]
MKWFLDLAGLTAPQVNDLIARANALEQFPQPDALAGKILTLLLLKPSFHTRVSMEAAMARLGGRTITIAPALDGWRIETGEEVLMDGDTAHHARELIPAMTACSDVLGIRAPGTYSSLGADIKETAFASLSQTCDIPLINLESALNHPCQSLADWKTLDDLNVPGRGGRLVLSWSANPVGHPLAVPAATLHMAAMRGMRVTVLRPPEFALPKAVLAKAQKAAEVSGGAVLETDDRERAMDGAHVVYAESWIAPQFYSAPEKDKALRARYADWRIDELWFKRAQETATFFHTLPVRRGVGVTDDILDGPRSMVIRQSRNRMLAQMAILHRMLGND